MTEDQMRPWAKRDFITFPILFVLMFTRFPIADFIKYLKNFFYLLDLSTNLSALESLQNQSVQFFYNYSFILVLFVAIINRSNIKELNIDKIFMFIMLGGGLAHLRTTSWDFKSALISVALIFMSILYLWGQYNFRDAQPNLSRTIFLVSIAFLLGILFIIDFISFSKINLAFQWLIIDIPLVIVEEVVFRGMLWMFLKKLNFSEYKIVILQAIFFWISHVYFASEIPVSFWVITPIMSIILGVSVWSTRSITSSIFVHVLFNIWWSLFAS
jgi:membrane protease YdiL (CAAX protease family)